MEVFEMPRSLERFEYFNSINHLGYFTFLCLMSNQQDTDKLKRGQLSLSRKKLSTLTKLTESQIRSIEDDLELSELISVKKTLNSSRIITVKHMSLFCKIANESQTRVVENTKETHVLEKQNRKRIANESQTNRKPKANELAPVIAPAEYIPPQGEATPEKVVAMWNRIAEQTRLPEVLFLNQDRKKRVSIAIETLKDCDCWRSVFDEMQEDDFLMGRIDGKNFKASFDWLLQCKRGTQTKNYILLYEKFILRTKKELDCGR